MCDFNSPTRDQTTAPCITSMQSYHWTTREVPDEFTLKREISFFIYYVNLIST